MKLSILTALNTERANRRAAVVVTDVDSGEQRLVKGADVANDPLREFIEKHIRSGKSGMEETPAGKVAVEFDEGFEPHELHFQLLKAGMPLMALARELGRLNGDDALLDLATE